MNEDKYNILNEQHSFSSIYFSRKVTGYETPFTLTPLPPEKKRRKIIPLET